MPIKSVDPRSNKPVPIEYAGKWVAWNSDHSRIVAHNSGCVHQTLRCTPAMKAGVTDHIWSIEEIVGLRDGIRE